mgnify:CR=1 FL=1
MDGGGCPWKRSGCLCHKCMFLYLLSAHPSAHPMPSVIMNPLVSNKDDEDVTFKLLSGSTERRANPQLLLFINMWEISDPRQHDLQEGFIPHHFFPSKTFAYLACVNSSTINKCSSHSLLKNCRVTPLAIIILSSIRVVELRWKTMISKIMVGQGWSVKQYIHMLCLRTTKKVVSTIHLAFG